MHVRRCKCTSRAHAGFCMAPHSIAAGMHATTPAPAKTWAPQERRRPAALHCAGHVWDEHGPRWDEHVHARERALVQQAAGSSTQRTPPPLLKTTKKQKPSRSRGMRRLLGSPSHFQRCNPRNRFMHSLLPACVRRCVIFMALGPLYECMSTNFGFFCSDSVTRSSGHRSISKQHAALPLSPSDAQAGQLEVSRGTAGTLATTAHKKQQQRSRA